MDDSTKVAQEYLSLLEGMEGFESKIYTDATGNLTIGFGHKLTEDEKNRKTFQDGVTKEEARELLKKDVFGEKGHYFKARQEFTNMFGEYDKKLGYSLDFEPWNTLTSEQKMMATDYSFNVAGGLQKFPKLMFALLEQDWGAVEEEYKRRIGKKELTRNEYIYDTYIRKNLDPNSSSGTIERVLNY